MSMRQHRCDVVAMSLHSFTFICIHHMVHGTWYSVHGTQYMVYGTRHTAHGTRCMVHGMWYIGMYIVWLPRSRLGHMGPMARRCNKYLGKTGRNQSWARPGPWPPPPSHPPPWFPPTGLIILDPRGQIKTINRISERIISEKMCTSSLSKKTLLDFRSNGIVVF